MPWTADVPRSRPSSLASRAAVAAWLCLVSRPLMPRALHASARCAAVRDPLVSLVAIPAFPVELVVRPAPHLVRVLAVAVEVPVADECRVGGREVVEALEAEPARIPRNLSLH